MKFSVDRQQHQLDGHQQDDQVLAVEEDADHRCANSTAPSARKWPSVTGPSFISNLASRRPLARADVQRASS